MKPSEVKNIDDILEINDPQERIECGKQSYELLKLGLSVNDLKGMIKRCGGVQECFELININMEEVRLPYGGREVVRMMLEYIDSL